MTFNSFSRVTHGVSRLRGFLVCVISIVPVDGAEARMRPIVSFYLGLLENVVLEGEIGV